MIMQLCKQNAACLNKRVPFSRSIHKAQLRNDLCYLPHSSLKPVA